VSSAGKQEGTDRYFCEENGVLPEQLGRAPLHEVTTFVGPERLLSWHRRLIASNYGVSQRRGAGPPLVRREIQQLEVRMITGTEIGLPQNPGASLANLSHKVARGTIAGIRHSALEFLPAVLAIQYESSRAPANCQGKVGLSAWAPLENWM
jgi:hypothetical protein